jgi:hypothetical protein
MVTADVEVDGSQLNPHFGVCSFERTAFLFAVCFCVNNPKPASREEKESDQDEGDQ